jgi:putative ABC transport system permease protein
VLHDGLDMPLDGMIFRPAAQFPRSGFSVAVRTKGNPLGFVDRARSIVRELDSAVPVYRVRTMRDIVEASVAARRTTMLLFTAFAALALILATVGIYAVAAQSVTRRTNEIGLRMAMGAHRRDVLGLVMRQELPAIIIGSLFGLLGAIGATRLMRASLFGVSASDPITFGAAIAILVCVACCATWIPARRASRLDPLIALRYE